MGFRINTNIAAMNSHSNSVMNNRNLDESLSKLSSGLRINKAADDASGMVIANSLRNQANSLGQAISNGNDAIGLIQTADGALNEYAKILDTIKTKAVQAGSDTQNTTSRLAIQKDIDRLMEELNMIARTTSFNGQKLLSGSFANKQIQMGSGSNETVKFSVASAETNQIGHTSRAVMNVGTEMGGEVQLNITSTLTGKNITLKPIDLQYNNNAENGMGAVANEINKYSGETGIKAKAIVETTSNSAVTAGSTGSDFAINGITIGAINVTTNDNSGTLVSAINGKTSQTGVSATISTDGKLTLKSNDGRAIEVTGDMMGVVGVTGKQMSTLGKIELIQSGSGEFQITGNGAGATGADITISSAVTTSEDSVLKAGSTIKSATTFVAGSTIGGNIQNNVATTLTIDGKLAAGSVLNSSSTLEEGTLTGAKIVTSNTAAVSINRDMFITAGSTLGSGTILGIGTVIGENVSISGVTYNKGDVLTSAVTFGTGTTLSLNSDWTLNYNGATGNSLIGGASTINVGSVIGADLTTTGTSTVTKDMTLKLGSIIAVSSTLAAGSVVGANTVTTGSSTSTLDTQVKAGSTLATATVMKEGSTIGAGFVVNASAVLNSDMTLKAGSILVTGSTLKAGTVLGSDMTASASGSVAIAAGTKLTTDITLAASYNITNEMTMLKGTGTTLGTIAAASTIARNTNGQGGVELSDAEFTSLASVNVLTFENAMKAIDTLDTAITDLDNIRADLGSVQNQVVATINNISVTQVNVKAAESQLRDVDFAAESANFSKFNILAQSGSYAMSQANAVQQNVLRLLQ
jgi:flagellin